ncbi:MAG TPA: hypothetical protein VHX86_06150 [Tepidisphaeraceae bacterium]|nr:hypothetical protein [Tepidisphaeraceae bacterium]
MFPDNQPSPPQNDAVRRKIEAIFAGYSVAKGRIIFYNSHIDDDCLRWILWQLKRLRGLRELNIASNELGYDGATALASCGHLSGLHTLNVSGNHLDHRGARALASSEYLSGLHTLQLSQNEIGDNGVAAIATSEYLSGLRHLYIGRNKISDEGAIVLAKSRRLSGLQSLCIDTNNISHEGAMALAASEHLSGLSKLDISRNDLGDKGANALVASGHLPSLCRLRIGHNDIFRPQTVINLCERVLDRRLRIAGQSTKGALSVDVRFNPLRWSGMEKRMSNEIQEETNPKKLRELLIRLKTDSTVILAAGLAFMGRTMHGKTHATRWVVADESDFESLRSPIPLDERTLGYDRYSITLSPTRHGHSELTELWLTVVDVGGHREQLNSVSNLVYVNARRSVFVLVVKASESFKHGNWGHYYLQLIESLRVQKRIVEDGHPLDLEDLVKSHLSPERIPVVLLVSHAKGKRNIELPEPSELKKMYPLLDVLVFDPWEALEGDQYLPALYKAIGTQVAKLRALRESVVSTTLAIRDEIVRRFELDKGFPDRVPPRINSMTVDEFRIMCRSLGETSDAVQDATVRELGALGFLTVVGGTRRLRPGTRLLNPRFVNHYLFAGILERGGLELKDGFMSNDWFDDLTHDIKDPLEIAELKNLMRDCLVTFEWRHGGYPTGQFVPDLLPFRPTDELPVWHDAQCKVKLRPKGFLNESAFFNFVSERRSDLRPALVEKSRDGSEKITVLFRNECVMRNEMSEALVKVDVIEQEIVIEVRGPDYATAQSYGDGLRLVFREKIGSDLEGKWEKGHATLAATNTDDEPSFKSGNHELKEYIIKLLRHAGTEGASASTIAQNIRDAIGRESRLQSILNVSADISHETVTAACRELRNAERVFHNGGRNKASRWIHAQYRET